MSGNLTIINARVRGQGDLLFNIGLNGNTIEAISPSGGVIKGDTLDVQGCLVTEGFVNAHLHLDKVYTFEMAGQAALGEYNQGGMGGAMTAIERAADFKGNYDESWILPNVRKVCDLALKYGNTHIRAFADVDPKARLEGVTALLKAREEYRDRLELQVVAFPQDGIAREPGSEELIVKAVKAGADVVGGIPWIELTRTDEQDHVDRMFAVARKYNKDVSMLVDDVGDPEERTLEMLCRKAIELKWQGRVTAQHCRAMLLYNENYFRKLVSLMKAAGIGVVADPQTGPLHARVKDLLAAGVPVALGQDDVADAYYPFGECNMLQVAFLAAHLLWMMTREDMELLYDMITTKAAEVLGIKGHRLEPGGNADLVVLDQPDVYHAIWYHQPPICVIKSGRVLKGG